MTLAACPSISIGLPVYNGARYLRAALENLLGQTWTDFELILSDNASTDETEAICREYAARDSRIRYIRQQKNIGAHGNFNFVLEEARGEYFLWAACDDLRSDNFLEVLHQCLQTDASSVGAQAQTIPINEQDERDTNALANYDLGQSSRWRRILALSQCRNTQVYVYGMYHTTYLRQIKMKPMTLTPRYPHSAEYPALFFLGTAGKISTCPDAAFYYRIHPQSEGARAMPLLASCLLRLELVFRSVGAAWLASRSLGTSLAALLMVGFYQARSVTWALLRGAVSALKFKHT